MDTKEACDQVAAMLLLTRNEALGERCEETPDRTLREGRFAETLRA